MENIGRYKRMLLLFLMFILKCLKTRAYNGCLGCFEDKDDRMLEKCLDNSDSNTAEDCKQRCDKAGFRYAATELGRECYCGNLLRHNTKASGCDMPCPGSNKEHCGGVWRLSLFQTRRFTTEKTSTTLHITSTRSTTVATTTTTSTTAVTTTITTETPVTTTELSTETESSYGHGLSTQESRSEDSSYSTVYISVSVVATLTTVVIFITAYLVKRRENHDENGSDCSQDMVVDVNAETNIYENQPTARYAEWVELGKQTDQPVIGHIYENQTTVKRANHKKQMSVKEMNNFVENCIYENQIVSDRASELGNEQPENNYETLQSERRLGDVYLSIDNVNQK